MIEIFHILLYVPNLWNPACVLHSHLGAHQARCRGSGAAGHRCGGRQREHCSPELFGGKELPRKALKPGVAHLQSPENVLAREEGEQLPWGRAPA